MLIRSVILFCILCCASGVPVSTPFDPEKIIYEFAFDPEKELFTPISPETVKCVHGISEMDVQTYDVNGLDYVIKNNGGYPTLGDTRHSSFSTSATEGTYKIGHGSAMGYFLYPTSALASETRKIKDGMPDLEVKVKDRTIYRVGNFMDLFFFVPSSHQYDPDILATSTVAPSTTEASESTASSQDISTLTSETPTTEAVESNTSSESPTISMTELNFSNSVTSTPKPAISTTESAEPTTSSQDTSTPVPEISTTESVDPITPSPVTSTPKSTVSTSEANDVIYFTPGNSIPKPDISTPVTILSPTNQNVVLYVVIVTFIITINAIIAWVFLILRKHFGNVNSTSSNYVLPVTAL